MWTVECARCGDPIEAESPEEIARDENDDPRHDKCEYAAEPSYPHSFTVSIRSKDSRLKHAFKRGFPHLTPRLEEEALHYVLPEHMRDIDGVRLRFRAGGDEFRDADVSLTHVDGEPLASHVPRVVYECEVCGTRVDGKVVYDTDGYRPFIHTNCPDASRRETAEFEPVEVSHLDHTRTEEEHEDILGAYREIYES